MSLPGADAPVPLPTAPVSGRFSALRSHYFRLLLAEQAVSLTGSQMQQVAVVWQLYLLTGSPLSLGMLGLFRIVPIVTFALGGGVVADAVDRRRLMLGSQTALALVSAAFAVLAHTGRTTPGAIYALTFAVENGGDGPARQALVPRLVSREQLPALSASHPGGWRSPVGPSERPAADRRRHLRRRRSFGR
jgi:hypothetical protein